MIYGLEGKWDVILEGRKCGELLLPGTLDEGKIGYPDISSGMLHPDEISAGGWDHSVITTRFTRNYTYRGAAEFTRTLCIPENMFDTGKPRLFLTAERCRCLSLLINKREVPAYGDVSLSTPYLFEVTDFLEKGDQEVTLTFVSDNSYPHLPAEEVLYSSAATDETQTNWNGILGNFFLENKEKTFLSGFRVCLQNDTITVRIEIDAGEAFEGSVCLSSEVLKGEVIVPVRIDAPGIFQISCSKLALSKKVRMWEEGEGNLYKFTATLSNGSAKTEDIGLRTFCEDGQGHFSLNGHRVFLLSEANCAEFPETGYPPMQEPEWEEILKKYKMYGVNHLRFHSHCPPEAAFKAADRQGMLLQPELSHWDPKHALESEESYAYYRKELLCILRQYANHPSFVMLTLGNELQAEELGHERMKELVRLAKETDATRMYAESSNLHYGWKGCDTVNDFYTAQQHMGDAHLRATFACHDKERRRLYGYLNNSYPNAKTNYDASMREVRKTFMGPVFGFEVGQYEILPDFEELGEFHGITRPDNLMWIKERVQKAGLLEQWKEYIEASGELSRICYREEVEAALRTKDFSGLSLLGIQDFPGQGTALVGMMNSHLQTKPYPFAQPERFRKFFTNRLPLVLLEKYTYTNTENPEADVMVANYGKEDIIGTLACRITVCGKGETNDKSEVIVRQDKERCPSGELTLVGRIIIPLQKFTEPVKLDLSVQIGEIENTYPIWVYPEERRKCPELVYETKHMNDKAKAILEKGGTVYLSPDSVKEQLPHSIRGQFSTDFWSVGTFSAQEGGMGLWIEKDHPVFKRFPTEFHTNWQWWLMAGQRAVILPEEWKEIRPIVRQLDSYAYLRPMAMLLECRCGNGKLLLSTMGLQQLTEYPEARALLNSIYDYLDSEEFSPAQRIPVEALEKMVK